MTVESGGGDTSPQGIIASIIAKATSKDAKPIPMPGDVVNATPRPPAIVDNSTGHQAFLLLIGEVIGVFILSWLAGLDDRLAVIIVAFMLVLWLLWIMNSTDVLTKWGAKVGL